MSPLAKASTTLVGMMLIRKSVVVCILPGPTYLSMPLVSSVLGSTFMPLWLGLGTFAVDLFIVVTLTSLIRDRLPHRGWHLVHLLSYVGWGASLAHSIGIGTDVKAAQPWAYAIVAASIGVVVIGGIVRLAQLRRGASLLEVA